MSIKRYIFSFEDEKEYIDSPEFDEEYINHDDHLEELAEVRGELLNKIAKRDALLGQCADFIKLTGGSHLFDADELLAKIKGVLDE